MRHLPAGLMIDIEKKNPLKQGLKHRHPHNRRKFVRN